MNNIKEEKNIKLSDEEILEIAHNIHVKYILGKDISEEEEDRLISLIPMTTKEIDFFVACGKSREKLEAENREILNKQGWINELR
ncbi:MAG: hypothetical protein MSA07_09890 [Mucispirillum sp.]|uniref:Uncharacterized protein n=1 Tax=Candidatus Mucispirillum faecigallinarum TaxID=2838699 RepID=A0A9D2KAC7_9BACT|nr:hypothetical protein [Mucispirillum sp.]HIZ88610.1 hypothetical protein [Candidatus Mucispirillum faecigallinarum]